MDNKNLFEKVSPIRLFAVVVIPGIMSMIVSTLYQIMDGVFVGNVLGSDAFAALNLAMPFVVINFSIADLIGYGSSVPISIKLGEKDEKSASNIFTNACIMIFCSAILIGGFLFFFADDIIRLMGADEKLVTLAYQYIRVYALCSPITTFVFAADNYLRICGKIKFSMVLFVSMSIVCGILEFLFLYVFRFGIWGAALATCLGMSICVAIALMPFLRGKTHLKFVKPVFGFKLFLDIVKNGAPSFLNNIAGRITSIIVNVYLLHLGGSTAVSAYGVLMYADAIIQAILYGLCDSIQPAVGYNWGAKNYKRVKSLERICFSSSAILSAVLTVLLLSSKSYLVSIFVKTEDVELMSMTIQAISIFSFAYVVRWFSFNVQSYMSAIGKARYAIILSVSIAFVFPVLILLVLQNLGLNGVWLNFPLSSLFSALLGVGILYKFKMERKNMQI